MTLPGKQCRAENAVQARRGRAAGPRSRRGSSRPARAHPPERRVGEGRGVGLEPRRQAVHIRHQHLVLGLLHLAVPAVPWQYKPGSNTRLVSEPGWSRHCDNSLQSAKVTASTAPVQPSPFQRLPPERSSKQRSLFHQSVFHKVERASAAGRGNPAQTPRGRRRAQTAGAARRSGSRWSARPSALPLQQHGRAGGRGGCEHNWQAASRPANSKMYK